MAGAARQVMRAPSVAWFDRAAETPPVERLKEMAELKLVVLHLKG